MNVRQEVAAVARKVLRSMSEDSCEVLIGFRGEEEYAEVLLVMASKRMATGKRRSTDNMVGTIFYHRGSSF